MKGKVTKYICKQVPVGIIFHVTSKLGNPIHSESFDKNKVRDFVDRLKYLQKFVHKLFKRFQEKPTEQVFTQETEKK